MQIVDHKVRITLGRAYRLPDEKNYPLATLSFDLLKKDSIYEYGVRFNEMKVEGVRMDAVADPPLIPRN